MASFPKVPKTYRPKFLKIDVFDYPIVVSSSRNPREYPHKHYIARNYSYCGTSLLLIVWVYLRANFRGGLRKRMYFETVQNGRSGLSKGI